MLHKSNKMSLGPILANSVGPAMGENYAKILSDYIYIYVKEIRVSIYSIYPIYVACAVSVFFPLTDSH